MHVRSCLRCGSKWQGPFHLFYGFQRGGLFFFKSVMVWRNRHPCSRNLAGVLGWGAETLEKRKYLLYRGNLWKSLLKYGGVLIFGF